MTRRVESPGRAADQPRLPRLVGPRVALVPVTREVARAVCAGNSSRLRTALGAHGLRAADDWPHVDSAPAMLRLTLDPALTVPSSPLDLASWLVTTEDVVVGDCGGKGGPDERGEVELGYGLCPAARGQGLGIEAVALLCTWVERQPGVTLLVAEVRDANEPSLRLLRRLGFSNDGLSTGEDPHQRLVRPAAPPTRPRGRHVC